MNRLVKTVLLAGAAWGALSATAVAQEASTEAQASNVDDIIVSARRRDEALKDVPVAVSVLSAEKLQQAGPSDITALQQQTPNATVQIARGSNSTLISFIRGVGQQDPLWGFEPGVGLYVDDVYVARPQGAVLDIFDIQRLEVLRGPQGTLYGRNTIGGAIKYVTNRLGDEGGLTARAQFGSFNEHNYLVSAKAPLGGGFSVGGAYAKYDRDGYGKNLTTGAETYNKDVTAYRLSAEYAPNDDLFFRLAYDKVEDNSNARHGHREKPTLTGGYQVLPGVYDTQAGLGDKNYVETEGLSFTAQWEATDKLTLKSITANREGHTQTKIDFDNTPLPTLDVPATYDDGQFSQELQAIYADENVQGVFGVYYMNSQASGEFDTIAGNLGLAVAAAGKINTQSFAVFTDVSANLTDKLKISVGARATRDHKTGTVLRLFYLGATPTQFQGGAPRPIFATRTNYKAEKTFEQFTPRLSVSYAFSDDVTGYASYSKGFKSGGWDMRGDAALIPQTVNGYKPETVDAYEVGLKGSLLDRRLSFSSAIFYSDYKDQQITTQQAATPPAVGIASVVDNVGASTIYGAEFEGSAYLSRHLSANFAVGYLHAEFDKFITLISGSPVDISNTRAFQNSPKWTGNLGVTWRGELAGGMLRVTPSLSYRDSYHLFDGPDPILDQKAYTLVDLGVVWDSPGNTWQLGLYGRNLTDETYRVGGYNFSGATYNDSVIGFYGPPKTWQVSIQYKF